MGRQTIYILALCAICVGAFGLFKNYFVHPVAQAKPVKKVQLVVVYSAKYPLKAQTLLKRQDVERKAIPLEKAAQFGIKQDQKLPFDQGYLLLNSVAQEGYITPDMLSKPDINYFMQKAKRMNMVAVPLKINGMQKLDAMLHAGDQVSLLQITDRNRSMAASKVEESSSAPSPDIAVSMLQPNIKLLSIEPIAASQTSSSDDASHILPGSHSAKKALPQSMAGYRSYQVIVAVPHSQVSRLLLAQRVSYLIMQTYVPGVTDYADMGDVVPDYSTVTELRAGGKASAS
ncbi:CpaB family protein [Dongshaea marina]|uniref:hypothetical protein n=1 Tax=Dongshaea marina TaxID=2047966 RepID=UPI000D3E9CDA|nr:hypothetical protein [Dongshaea marina]